MIVGLSGYARSGKDTAGEALVEAGYERRAMADAVKRFAAHIGWDGQKDETGRRLLQDVGVAAREVFGEGVWVDATLGDLDPDDRVVVTDVRFRNEASAISDVGGIIVRVTRPGVGPANDHVSEVDLDDWGFDATITNDGTIADLRRKILDLVGEP